MKKFFKKLFTKENLLKFLKYFSIWGCATLLILIITILCFSCHPVENNKKQAINLTQLRNSSSFNFVSSDFNNPEYWDCFYISDGYIENDIYDIDIDNWYYNVNIGNESYTYYIGGIHNQLNNYIGLNEIYLYLQGNDEWYTSIYVSYDSGGVVSLLIYDDDARSTSITISSGSISFGYDTTISNNLDAYYYSGGDISSEEPVTSEPVTSEPTTSELLNSSLVIESEAEPNSNRYITLSSYLDFNLIYGEDYVKTYVPNLYYRNSLSNVYEPYYDLDGISFYLQGQPNIVYNKIRVVFGRLSELNFDNLQETLNYLAFIDKELTIDSMISDFYVYQGGTNYTNLLGLRYGLENYYYVKEVYYVRSSPLEYLKVFDGVRTKNLTYYVNNAPASSNPALTPTSFNVDSIVFVRNGWLNSSYRRLVVTYDSETLLDTPNLALNDYTLVDFLTNNTGVNNEVIDYGFNSIYSLITGAFYSIAPILNLMILPNITIGMLLLVPLLFGVMLAIIRLIKK